MKMTDQFDEELHYAIFRHAQSIAIAGDDPRATSASTANDSAPLREVQGCSTRNRSDRLNSSGDCDVLVWSRPGGNCTRRWQRAPQERIRMSCDLEYFRRYSYFDGELSVIRAAEFSTILHTAPDCMDESPR